MKAPITEAMIDRVMCRVYENDPEYQRMRHFMTIEQYMKDLRRIEANQKAFMQRITRKP